jgi:succinylglutamic semialdehyde dehydrogenase
MMEVKPMKYLGDYIGGQFVPVERADGEFEKRSPADLNDQVLVVPFSYSHVDQACEAAKLAFQEWAMTPQKRRVELVMKIKEKFAAAAEELALTISRDTGKPLWEAHTEVKSMLGKFDITADHSLKLIEEQVIENALPGVKGFVRFRPRGVMAILGPFNFPGHLPNGHIVPALMTGNTVVFKPSEHTPTTAQVMARLIHEAGLPQGVFNLVQGAAETGKRLVAHELVDGILFTGSYDVGLKIKEKTHTHFWKILALEMGGKNASIVWNDADMNKALYENIVGSFISAGQRCSCTSRIVLHRDIADNFIERFYQTAKKLKIGHWSEQAFMGPLINEDAVEKYVRFQEIGVREGAERIMRGKVLDLDHKGYYVTPSILKVPGLDKKSVYQQNEIFGPNVAFYIVDDFEEALTINNSTGFGLVTSVFSKRRDLYEAAVQRAKVGLVNWNRTTNGASSRLPFGGCGKSGNDRPTAHYAVYYCTTPVASLEDEQPFDPNQKMPGMEFTPIS